MKSKKVYFLIPAVAAAVLLMAGCQKKDPAAVVEQRSVERWNLLIAHQPVKAYDYLSPGYRTTHTLDQYVALIASARLKWKSVKSVSQECDNEVCTVRLEVTSTVPGQAVGLPHDISTESPVTEQWVSSDGQWYFLPNSGIKPADMQKATEPAGDEAAPATTAQPTAPGQNLPAQPQPAGNDGK